jgi:hypothetical protein
MSTTATLAPREAALVPSFGERIKADPAYQVLRRI